MFQTLKDSSYLNLFILTFSFPYHGIKLHKKKRCNETKHTTSQHQNSNYLRKKRYFSFSVFVSVHKKKKKKKKITSEQKTHTLFYIWIQMLVLHTLPSAGFNPISCRLISNSAPFMRVSGMPSMLALAKKSTITRKKGNN